MASPATSPRSVRSTPSLRQSMASSVTRLAAIEEDGPGIKPDLPARSPFRPIAQMLHLGSPPPFSSEKAPPPYVEYNDIIGPGGQRLSDLRNNKHIAKRGGWGKLCMLSVLVLLLLIGLVIGLAVGLTSRRGNSRYGILGQSLLGKRSCLGSQSGCITFVAAQYFQHNHKFSGWLIFCRHLSRHRRDSLYTKSCHLAMLPICHLQRIQRRCFDDFQLGHHPGQRRLIELYDILYQQPLRARLLECLVDSGRSRS